MVVKSKYSVNDTVFIYDKGFIIECIIKSLDILVDSNNKVSVMYKVEARYDNGAERLSYKYYEEEEIASSVQSIIDTIPVL